MLTVFDLLLFGVAVVVMLRGFHRRRSWVEWAKNDKTPGDWKALLGYLLNHRPILARRAAGLSHLALFWGTAFMVAIVVAAQFKPTLPRGVSNTLSLLSNGIGAAMLVGVVFFIVRRLRAGSQNGPRRAILPLGLLFVIVLTGFLSEGARLSIVPDENTWTSPVGWLFSLGLPDSPLLMQLMIRVHFFGVLLLAALLPFTAFRHIGAAAMNVFHASSREKGALRPLSLESGDLGAGRVTDLTWAQCLSVEACVSCGRCEEQCPAAVSGKTLSPRSVVQGILSQMESLDNGTLDPRAAPTLEEAVPDRDIWSCTGCMACAAHCPVLVDPTNKIQDMRRYRTMKEGRLPTETRPMIRDLMVYGDVNGQGAARRMDWAFGQDVPVIAAGGTKRGVLIWVGCSGAFHPQYREAAVSLVKILKQADVSFGVLGKGENCCGDPARRLGEESLFLDLAEKNLSMLEACRVKTVVPLCPHCYHTLLHDYRGLGAGFTVIHAVDYVLGLVREKRIHLKYPLEKKAALHDPCYLGRANGLYDPIRDLLKSIPGVELSELPRNRDKAFCCGGGNGGMWLHEDSGDRINRIRAGEAAKAGIDLLCTACPYCLTMLQDGMGSLENGPRPAVVDLICLTADSLHMD